MEPARLHHIKLEGNHELSSVELLIGNKPHAVRWTLNKNIAEARFNAPVVLPDQTILTLRIRHHRFLGIKQKDLTIQSQALLMSVTQNNRSGDIQEYHHQKGEFHITATIKRKPPSKGGNKVVPPSTSTVEPDKLVPTTDDISKICPQFRILLLGKTGVGKSSLLNAVFGGTIAEVQHDRRGEADIDSGLTTPENKHLILHDTRGFEPGEEDTFHLVEKFIQDRACENDIKERLHAIWLCLKAPTAGDRLIEVSTEKLLEMKSSGKMGGIPLIIVLTKYDELVKEAKYDIMEKLKDNLEGAPPNINEQAKVKASERIEADCTTLKDLADGISCVVVSTKEGYKESIENLVKMTYSVVGDYVKSGEPSLMVAIAQRASPGIKIDAIIRVGKKRYWSAITAGSVFFGKTLKECLEVIHIDIVDIWNFDDKQRLLHSPSFHKQMHDLLKDVDKPNHEKPKGVLTVGVPMVGVLSGIMIALAGPAAPIVLPVAAVIVFAAWLYGTYNQTDATLRLLMCYIVDLTLVMQNVYCLHKTGNRPLDARILAVSVEFYKETFMDKVHGEIYEYVLKSGGISGKGRDRVLEKVVELIEGHKMSVEDMEELNKGITD